MAESGSATTADAARSGEQQVRDLIESHDYCGFGDLDHLKTLPSTNKARLHSKLLNSKLVEGVPFPASVALVRAVLSADDQIGGRGDRDLRVEPHKLRFGVYHQQMTQVKEVGFGDLKAAFDRVRFHRDVNQTDVLNLRYLDGHVPGGSANLLEWRGYEFYSIPAPTSNTMWDLFEMGKTTWAKTQEAEPGNHHSIHHKMVDEVWADTPTIVPLLVAANRNQEEIEFARRKGQRIPAVPMSQHGAVLHLVLFVGPRTPTPGAYQEMVKTHFNILGDEGQHLRPYAPEEVWLVAYYEPPPRLLVVEKERFRFLGMGDTPDPTDIWVQDLNRDSKS